MSDNVPKQVKCSHCDRYTPSSTVETDHTGWNSLCPECADYAYETVMLADYGENDEDQP